MDRVTVARVLARLAHWHQVDKLGVTYLAHVEDVARRVRHLGDDHEIVALVHDAIEDTPLRLADIEALFGAKVSSAVDAMTKRKGEDYQADYLPRLKADPLAVAVKIADSSHNPSKAHLVADSAEQDRLRTKYRNALGTLGVDAAAAERPLVYDPSSQRWVARCPKGRPPSHDGIGLQIKDRQNKLPSYDLKN